MRRGDVEQRIGDSANDDTASCATADDLRRNNGQTATEDLHGDSAANGSSDFSQCDVAPSNSSGQ